MKSKSKAPLVLEHYPKAKPIKVKNHVEIHSDDTILGKGKNNRCAWESAYKNYIN